MGKPQILSEEPDANERHEETGPVFRPPKMAYHPGDQEQQPTGRTKRHIKWMM
ncbi:hypothetical protein MXD59_16580 [Frankia sp. Ag45/Mut15]|uniref:Uncharacterized protein n=1 Tax=Frankia umida TaxID=573489 RepID=A0ABT0K0M9_9ACTN|nr:hypothetical protein [Frankia umida]MCK9877365.1 hypothetical protein [Frankia umida]